MQGRNRDPDVENGRVDTERDGRMGQIEREALVDTYTLPHVKQAATESCRTTQGAQLRAL